MFREIFDSSILFFSAIAAYAYFLFAAWPAIDPDLFARLAVGRLVLQHGGVPLVDTFAWTETLPRWIDHEWLSGVLFFLLFGWGGERLLFLFKIAVAAGTALALRGCAVIQRANSGFCFVFLGLILFASSFLWFGTVRCQIFTYLLLAFYYYAIVRHRLDGSKSWLIIAAVAQPFWANLHGGFTLGLIALGIYACVRALQRCDRSLVPLACVAVAAAGTLINPYGVEYWRFVFAALAKPRPAIAEWSAVPLLSVQAILPALCVIGVLGHALSDDQRKRGVGRFFHESYLLLAFTAYCSFRHARLLPLVLFTTYAFFPVLIEDAGARVKKGLEYLMLDRICSVGSLFVLGISVVSLLRFIAVPSLYRPDYSPYPVTAIDWALKNLPPGRILNSFNEGSYILWSAHPHLRISIDGRYEETYPEQTFEINRKIFARDTGDRRALVDAWMPNYILVRRAAEIPAASFGPEWKEVFQDERWFILRRGAG